MKFRPNLNMIDRLVRLVVGLVCIYYGFIESALIGNQMIATVIGIFGIVNIISTLTAFCIVYALTGVSTRKDSAQALKHESEA